ncbi:MAG: hypothetical protein QM479_16080 [Pseudomonadota bacterium]
MDNYSYFVIDGNGYIKSITGGNSPKADYQDDLIENDGTDRSNDMWDFIANDWKTDDRPLPPVQHLIDKIDFYDLFTDSELELITEQAKIIAKVDVFIKKIESLAVINLKKTSLKKGLDALEVANILSSGRASEIYNAVNSDVQIYQPPRG